MERRPERPTGNAYKERLLRELKNPSFNEVFRYNQQGELVLRPIEGIRTREISLVEIFNRYSEGGALQITDLGMIRKRARQLKEIWHKSADAVGYPREKLQLHHASKVNIKGPNIKTAASELEIETSGEFDVFNIMKMRRRGHIRKDIKVISNGFIYNWRQASGDRGYAQRIVDAFNDGVDITPVLSPNMLDFFRKNVTKGVMDIGLRLKFGQKTNQKDLEKHVSRFGFTWNGLQTEAREIKSSPNLRFTMLHAMITAAQIVEPGPMAASALFAAEMWAVLKKEHPTLTHLNFGGGFPTIDSGFDHETFLKMYFSGVKDICRKHGVDLPIITLESGSFVAADTEHLIYPVVDTYQNSTNPYREMNVTNTIMNMQDIWVQEDPFTFVALDKANDTPVNVRLGDSTCDSNCTYPPKDRPNEYILMPERTKAVVGIMVGAYQDVLGAINSQREAKSVGHCGLRDPKQVYITEDGRIWVNTLPSMEEMSNLAGYNDQMLSLVK